MKTKITILITILTISCTAIAQNFTDINKKNQDKKSNNKLSLHISTNRDSCYYVEDKLKVSIIFRNNSYIPVFIDGNMPIWQMESKCTEIIQLNLFQDSCTYYNNNILNHKNLPKKYCLTHWNPLKTHMFFSFSSLISCKYIWEDLKKVIFSDTPYFDNTDFGVYSLQALYINDSRDTVFSNIINVDYLFYEE